MTEGFLLFGQRKKQIILWNKHIFSILNCDFFKLIKEYIVQAKISKKDFESWIMDQ